MKTYKKLLIFLSAFCVGMCFEFCIRVQLRIEPLAISVLLFITCMILVFEKEKDY